MKEIYVITDLRDFIYDDTQTKARFFNLTIKKRKHCISVFDSDGYRIISVRYISVDKMYLMMYLIVTAKDYHHVGIRR